MSVTYGTMGAVTTPDELPDDDQRRGRHAADPALPSSPAGSPRRSPYEPPATSESAPSGSTPSDGTATAGPRAPRSWSPPPGPGLPHLSDEAYARVFAEIERAAASWAPPPQQHHRSARQTPPAAAYRDPRGWSEPAPRSRPRRPVGWLVLVVVLILTVVGLDRGLGAQRASPTLDVPRAQWLGQPRGSSNDWPPPGIDEQDERILPAVTPAGTGTYALLSDTTTWSPCRQIRIVIDPTGAPRGFDEWLGQVLAEASSLSGLSIVIEGTTDERVSFGREPYQPDRYGDRWAPAIIGWATPAEIPELEGNVAGLGGAQIVTRGTQTGYVTGGVALDLELLDVRHQRGEPAYVGVLRHEVGHLLGLGHVDEPDALMHGGANSISQWGAGEAAGLAALGAGACTPRL